jgi:hypothetical protein
MERPRSTDSTVAGEQFLDQSVLFELPASATWMTEWSCYVGEERLGKVRFLKTRYGLYSSVGEATLKGHTILTGPDLDSVVTMTYWHLKWGIDGYDGIQSTFSSVVSGKL